MNKTTLKPIIKNIKKDGTANIVIRITINRVLFYFPTNIFVLASNFDKKQGIVKNIDKRANEFNYLIDNEKQKINKKIIELQLNGEEITFDKLIEQNKSDQTFIAYANYVMEEKKHLYKNGSFRKNKADITKFEKYKPKLQLLKFDLKELKAYEKYMYNVLNNKTNTVAKSMAFIRMVLNYALNEERISQTPFNQYKIKKAPTNRVFLDKKQLMKLENSLTIVENEKIINTIKAFLFSCNTGLRYTDIQRLKPNSIFEDKLLITQEKTSEQLLIPLTERAKNLIDFKKKELNFTLYSNVNLNKYLKEVALLLGFDRKLTFHSARHTFATVGIELGIPIEVISKLLGHNDLKTTQIYAKIVDSKKVEEMNKFNW